MLAILTWPDSLRPAPKRLWQRWTSIAHAIGTFQARVLLTVFYLAVAPPFALVARLTDPLRLRAPAGPSYWDARTVGEMSEKTARRQF
jgi:hypothetical protein